VSQGTMFVEHHIAARGMRDMLNSQVCGPLFELLRLCLSALLGSVCVSWC
jgi:hypothetical protein